MAPTSQRGVPMRAWAQGRWARPRWRSHSGLSGTREEHRPDLCGSLHPSVSFPTCKMDIDGLSSGWGHPLWQVGAGRALPLGVWASSGPAAGPSVPCPEPPQEMGGHCVSLRGGERELNLPSIWGAPPEGQVVWWRSWKEAWGPCGLGGSPGCPVFTEVQVVSRG